uniref:Ribosomal protein L24 n=2 Tax=Myripristis murdjan TaxID=586833 RepID=A0A667YLD7_9TELE
MAKRNQKPEVRKAQREQAIRAAKEAKKAKQATKKPSAPSAKAPAKTAPKPKIAKPMKVSAPRVGVKTLKPFWFLVVNKIFWLSCFV